MKVAIFTQPIKTNYGGILQAFSLQKVIHKLGHDVVTIHVTGHDQYKNFFHHVLGFLKRLLLKLFFKKNISIKWNLSIPQAAEEKISCSLRAFSKNNIDLTEQVKFHQLKKYTFLNDFDAYVVGSDQVWASNYCPEAFLPFIKGKDKIKITYAASSNDKPWYSSYRTRRRCAKLIKSFKAISVRENALAEALQQQFAIPAEVHVDPTMILRPQDYLSCIALHEETSPVLCSYILDLTPAKASIEKHIATKLSLNVKRENARQKYSLTKQNDLDACTYPSIDEWLSTYNNCDFIVTDSFHGTVFAILFNRPFICLGNKVRGSARFDTLLGTFGLKDRMISNTTQEEIDRILNTPIDWERVNDILELERQRGINYLKENLKDK